MTHRIKIGISRCLLGDPVRYDGGHKLDKFLRDTLGQYVDYYPLCPEVEAGFGIPREAFRLVGDARYPRFITSRTGEDFTERMTRWSEERVRQLEEENLGGFIFKSGSPSSGMERVRVYTEKGMPAKQGVGVFARAFMERFPLIPVEEEGRLHDPKLRENFIEAIFTLMDWRDTLGNGKRIGGLVDFHTRHKLLILSHSEKHYRAMGKLVAGAKGLSPDRAFSDYEALLLGAMKLKTTPKKNVNVLMHMMGYFKRLLTPDEKQEILEKIDAFRAGHLPLIVPVTLINHYVRKYREPYLQKQTYLQPHPLELRLRNHV